MKTAATVLTVDDDPIVRTDLRLVLEDAGFHVCADAKDGEEAVELARTHRPDVILLDLRLPRLGGVEATRRIMDDRPVPIVALTGYGAVRDGIAEDAIAAGAVSVVRKPFSHLAVVEAVSEALSSIDLRVCPRGAIGELLAALDADERALADVEPQAFTFPVSRGSLRRVAS